MIAFRSLLRIVTLCIALVVYSSKPVRGNLRLGRPKKLAVGETNHQRALLGKLTIVGEDGDPASAFPLGRCEGDCDIDEDCKPGLSCFQRTNGDKRTIPGCEGELTTGRDYCYDPSEGDTFTGSSNTNVEPDLFLRDGGGPSISVTPLALCEGDCEHNGDCAGSLVCFQRGAKERVPGCSGRGDSGVDYCYNANAFGGSSSTPAPSPVVTPSPSSISVNPIPLSWIGNNVNYALGRCEGDCDDDADCEGDLRCYQRGNGKKSIPGCIGEAEGNWDYCYARQGDGDATPAPTPSVDVTLTPITPSPTANSSPSPTPSPTVKSTILATKAPTLPPTPVPTVANQLVLVGDNDSPSSAFPLQQCQGDCDRDDDCDGSLMCFQRGFGEGGAPGCVGTPVDAKDYCYDPTPVNPPDSTTELTYVGEEGDGSPLGNCEGDCDDDGDCEGSLVCFFRDSGDTDPIPGCTGSFERGRDYCYYKPGADQTPSPTDAFGGFSTSPPTSAPTTHPPTPPTAEPTTPFPTPPPTPAANELKLVGNNEEPSSAWPLGHCEGDCDDDNDCAGGLECFQRGDFAPVPGCVGDGDSGRDYCYDPADGNGPQEENEFKLKLYWQDGYMWQESPKEVKWCIHCEGGNCKSNHENVLMVDYCDKVRAKFEFVYPGGNGTQIKLVGRDLCVTRIRTRALSTAPCEDTNIRQRFHSGLGQFDSERFEIKPTNKEGCVSQHHHAKPDEVVYVETCAKAHRAETGYWTKYYD